MTKQSDKTLKSPLRLLLRIIPVATITTILYCTASPIASGDNGSGTGVGNGAVITGKVIGADLQPVDNALVRLRTDMYLADTSGQCSAGRNDTLATVQTDEHGEFIIDSVRFRKSYCIEVIDTTCECHLGIVYKVDIGPDTLSDTVRLPVTVAKPVKEINGAIILNGLPQNAYVQIYGLERVGRTDSTGRFEIRYLPEATDVEGNEYEYKVKITVLQSDNTVKTYDSELEITFDNNQNVIEVEFELQDD